MLVIHDKGRVETHSAAEVAGPPALPGAEPSRAPPMFFSYHRGELPILLTIIVLGAIELGVVHLVLIKTAPSAAIPVSVVTLFILMGLAWVAATIWWRPIEIDGEQIRIRAGSKLDLHVAIRDIEAVDDFNPDEAGDQAHAIRATVTAHPNLGIRLRSPVSYRWLGLRRDANYIGICPDDPLGFSTELHKRLAATQ